MLNQRIAEIKKQIARRSMATVVFGAAFPTFWPSLEELPRPLAVVRLCLAVGAFLYLILTGKTVGRMLDSLPVSTPQA